MGWEVLVRDMSGEGKTSPLGTPGPSGTRGKRGTRGSPGLVRSLWTHRGSLPSSTSPLCPPQCTYPLFPVLCLLRDPCPRHPPGVTRPWGPGPPTPGPRLVRGVSGCPKSRLPLPSVWTGTQTVSGEGAEVVARVSVLRDPQGNPSVFRERGLSPPLSQEGSGG